jgi:predicted nucleic acid-binding Zn ribbon protein
VSATQETPPPEPSTPAPAPERHCRRCGATLGPDQEWCLACGAAAQTEVARPRGWRLPLILAAVVLVLAIAAVVLAIAELSRGPEKVAQATPTPTPSALASPAPTLTPSPTGAPENEGDQPPVTGATPTPSPGAVNPVPGTSATPSPSISPSPSPGATASPTTTPSAGGETASGSFADWPSGKTAWTVILESATSRSQAESVARDLQSKGDSVGILHSNAHSSLKPGYWVVFSGQYDTQKAAQQGMDTLASKPADAYVRKVSAS